MASTQNSSVTEERDISGCSGDTVRIDPNSKEEACVMSEMDEANCDQKLQEVVSRRFENFVVKEVLAENSQRKLAFVHGRFEGKNDDAVVTLEKTPFSVDNLKEILSNKSETSLTLENDIYSTFNLFPTRDLSAMKASVIYPATQKHMDKYRSQELHFIHESADDYSNITLPFLESEAFSIQWVYNILEKKCEADRIVFEDSDTEKGFVLLPDMKWDRKQLEDLYLVAIVHRREIKSLRDLRGKHLPLLKNILEKGTAAIKENFGIPASKLRIFFHYQPSYYHLHVHFTHLKFDAPGKGVERAHLLSDVIENIEYDDGFYQRKTLSFTVREGDKLYKLYKEADKV